MERLGQRGAPILALSILVGLLSSFLPVVAIADEPTVDIPAEEIPQTPILEPGIELEAESPSTFAATTIPAATVNYFIFENFLQRYGGEYGDTYQTALKVGDDRFDPTLYIIAEGGAPTVTVDLSELGVSEPMPLFVDGPLNSIEYYAYPGRTRPVVAEGVPDGLKTITATITNTEGTVTTATYSIHVDSTAPTMTITSVDRTDASSITGGSTLLLSGTIDGTGTDIRLYEIHQNEYGTDGAIVHTFQIQGMAGTEDVFGLANGAFTNVPLTVQSQLGDGLFHPETTSLTYSFLAIDEAGNQVLVETPHIPLQGEVIPPTPSVSNVLFLPGIKGSRLYGDDGNKLWIPGGDSDVRELFLNVLGKSERDDILVRKNDILAQVEIPLAPIRIYQSFVEKMDELQTTGMIADWEAVPYDWRLSLPDIINNGVERDGKIYYTEPTDTPYIERTLRELAATSKTGKVTIVAHSNGGLVAKALMQELGDVETATLIDDVFLVGVPQSGAPQALAAILYGYEEGIPAKLPFYVSEGATRQLAENTPMAYHLLPSAAYFNDVFDSIHAVGVFDDERGWAREMAAYGRTLNTWDELSDFVLAREGGRIKPSPDNLDQLNVGNEGLLKYANDIHNQLDEWEPPAGIFVHQIAGWGAETFAGVSFKTFSIPWLNRVQKIYTPIHVVDGDRTVPIPSALLIPENENVERYWVDLKRRSSGLSKNYSHKDLLEIDPVISLITQHLEERRQEPLPEDIYLSQPLFTDIDKSLRFYLHSPLTLEVFDDEGNHVGLGEDGDIDIEIEGSEYGVFGEVQYITVPAGPDYRLVLNGQDDGIFALEVQETQNGDITEQVTFAGIPSTSETIAVMQIAGEIEETTSLTVDSDGDGTNEITLIAGTNETAIYTPEETETESTSSGSRGQASTVGEASFIPDTPLNTLLSIQQTLPKLAETKEPLITKNTQGEVLGISETNGEDVTATRTDSSYETPIQLKWLIEFIDWVYNLISDLIEKLRSYFV